MILMEIQESYSELESDLKFDINKNKSELNSSDDRML